ncbi:hypothetical protein QTO34_014534, partial [Cnephaeus nilssonii]
MGGSRSQAGAVKMTENNFWLKKIEISVSEAEKRTGRNAMNMQETYTAYLVETRSVEHIDGPSVLTDSLWRRYSEFELLRNYLLVYYPHIVVPPLPEKRAEFVWHKLSADNMDPDFVERRRIGLENFLLRVASHPILCRDKIFYLFLTQCGSPQGWKATRQSGEGDTPITPLLLPLPAPQASAGPACLSLSPYASSIDDILEDEEHYADQLKEYLFYAEALRAVCRKHELMQYDLEMAAQDLASKKQQCEELATGPSPHGANGTRQDPPPRCAKPPGLTTWSCQDPPLRCARSVKSPPTHTHLLYMQPPADGLLW